MPPNEPPSLHSPLLTLRCCDHNRCEMAAQMPAAKKAARALKTQEEKDTTAHVVVVLEQASLEVVKTKKVRRVVWKPVRSRRNVAETHPHRHPPLLHRGMSC